MTRTNNYRLIQAELNLMKLKPGLRAFYVSRKENDHSPEAHMVQD